MMEIIIFFSIILCYTNVIDIMSIYIFHTIYVIGYNEDILYVNFSVQIHKCIYRGRTLTLIMRNVYYWMRVNKKKHNNLCTTVSVVCFFLRGHFTAMPCRVWMFFLTMVPTLIHVMGNLCVIKGVVLFVFLCVITQKMQ